MAELVAVRVPTAADLVAAWDRLAGLGDAILPLPADAADGDVARTLATLRPAALLHPRPDGVLRLSRLPDPLPVEADTAVVVATSGSTGAPKGVVLSRAALSASTAASVRRLGCRPGERWLLCLPLSHVAGLQVVLRSRAVGEEPVLHDGFDVEAVARDVEDGSVAWVSLVPTQLTRLLDAGLDLARLRGILLGGAPPGGELLARAEAAGASVTVSYGMTETCGGCVYDGHPLPGVEVAVGGDGRLRFRGDVLFDGYRGRPDLTAAAFDDGWFTSADLGRRADDGRIEVLGRADDVIITGGENVAASVVTEAVETHPAVRAAVVVGRPDPEWGERVVAVCERVDRSSRLDLDGLRAHLRDRLPPHALPRQLLVVDELPRNAMGKALRDAVQDLLDAR
ncbi:MAG: AMP-binding protein [Actinobacteria bacterium]|nr:AMP-binding protein [Actinomycetota bacterium]